ncbi:DUF397 domain-containing protein [Nocardia sp. NPDC057455]|uniref:DUF397 domain-containing protein n=1 Tax=Nocardia sp. NPDC057455 TaxID=3346138 RepID=UPI0036722990
MAGAEWCESSRTATHSDCVEVAFLDGGEVGVRDSNNPMGSVLVFAPTEWDAFTVAVRSREFAPQQA